METPIIIGVGDIKNRNVQDAKEPATLMLEAIQIALKDASPTSNLDLQSEIDSIDVVKTWTWPYPDLPGLLAQKLGVQEILKWKRYSEHGGNQPGKLFDEAAKRIARGECKVALLTGSEALASRASNTNTNPMYYKSHSKLTTPSILLCSHQKPATTRLDRTLRSRRHRLHPDRARPRKQFVDINSMAATLCSLILRPGRDPQDRRADTCVPLV